MNVPSSLAKQLICLNGLTRHLKINPQSLGHFAESDRETPPKRHTPGWPRFDGDTDVSHQYLGLTSIPPLIQIVSTVRRDPNADSPLNCDAGNLLSVAGYAFFSAVNTG